jgi:hypothetical protein
MTVNGPYEAKPAVRGEEPLLIGLVGPPGGGKTVSSLRLAVGMQEVRGGDIHLIDTEAGRSRKYCDQFKFNIVELERDARSPAFLAAIEAQLPRRPAAIVVDSMSDEHEAYLAWHDEMVPKVGGNEWAAWAAPKGGRKQLINGILKIKTPLIYTFRAREKTKQEMVGAKKVVTPIGWKPVAPLEIVHTLDLVCLLPPRADGVPVWRSDKVGEDFIIKLPTFLAPYITEGHVLDEGMGAAFARWAKGEGSPPGPPAATTAPSSRRQPESDGAVTERLLFLDAGLDEAAGHGMAALETAWKQVPKGHKAVLKGALDQRHKPRAEEVDRLNQAIEAD